MNTNDTNHIDVQGVEDDLKTFLQEAEELFAKHNIKGYKLISIEVEPPPTVALAPVCEPGTVLRCGYINGRWRCYCWPRFREGEEMI